MNVRAFYEGGFKMIIKGHFSKGDTPLDQLKEEDKKRYFCVEVNGHIQELTYEFPMDMDATLEFLDLHDNTASRIYETSIRYVVSLAVKSIDKRLDCKFFYNISRSIFCRLIGKKKIHITPSFVAKIAQRVHEIVAADIPFSRIKISKEDALKIYHEQGYVDKMSVLKYRPENFVHLYKSEIFDMTYYDYLYSPMVPSSGYLKDFILRFYEPGFLIQTPRSECDGKIPPFEDEIKFASTLADVSKWTELNQLDTASNVNRFIKKYGALALINLCESRMNDMLADLGRAIVSEGDIARLICVAGPSSSGKTSFANRLTYELMAKGLRPIRISIDDFYIPKGQLPKGTDIESIDAIDIDFFNKTISSLLYGEAVSLPHYTFKEGIRSFNKPIVLSPNQPIIIEGIHALNNKLASDIPAHQKYRVYISPQPQINIDNHTPMSMTDLRLLRRITRDARTRGADAKTTISMWPSVRNGEFKYIYPTEENADFVFDTFMPYEPCALRSFIMPLLNKVSIEDNEYITANRLKALMKYFLPIEITDIPCNSLIREFVGGSSFKDAR